MSKILQDGLDVPLTLPESTMTILIWYAKHYLNNTSKITFLLFIVRKGITASPHFLKHPLLYPTYPTLFKIFSPPFSRHFILKTHQLNHLKNGQFVSVVECLFRNLIPLQPLKLQIPHLFLARSSSPFIQLMSADSL